MNANSLIIKGFNMLLSILLQTQTIEGTEIGLIRTFLILSLIPLFIGFRLGVRYIKWKSKRDIES